MPSITETMRSTVPEATGKKDLRAEKPRPPHQNRRTLKPILHLGRKLIRLSLASLLSEPLTMLSSMLRKSKRYDSPSWKAITRLTQSASQRTCSTWSE